MPDREAGAETGRMAHMGMTFHTARNRKKWRRPLRGVIGLAAGLSLAMALACSCSRQAGTSPPAQRDVRERYDGAWQRTDGGYWLRVQGAASAAGLNVEYRNPRPIHVARSELRPVTGGHELIVELRDAGYPGSTYTLRHNADADTLVGVYFHAGLKQSFNVKFVRAPSP